jgi:hypothetical protein
LFLPVAWTFKHLLNKFEPQPIFPTTWRNKIKPLLPYFVLWLISKFSPFNQSCFWHV